LTIEALVKEGFRYCAVDILGMTRKRTVLEFIGAILDGYSGDQERGILRMI
jgi:hypothetical protein